LVEVVTRKEPAKSSELLDMIDN